MDKIIDERIIEREIDNKNRGGNNNIKNRSLKSGWLSLLVIVLLVINVFSFVLYLTPTVFSQGSTFCCEKTGYGAWCQNEAKEKCDSDYRKTPTSCDATSFCRLGCCYDSNEGICMINTPQKVCQDNNGIWQENKDCEIPQCDLGCCVLGTQAAYVSLQRCKKLSGFYGLHTDFRTNIGNEFECIAIAQSQDQGACVYEDNNFQRQCKFTTRGNCAGLKTGNSSVSSDTEFHKDYLCSADELGTSCGKTKQTTIIEGKDEVYFLDSCGNVANIYDAGKVDDELYWTKIVSKEDSCGAGKSNANSADCGNCDYFLGSIGKLYSRTRDRRRAKYGDYICRDLSCRDDEGKKRMNGESWCVYDEKGKDVVGARHFRKSCFAGEITIEACEDFRNEQCVEAEIETSEGKFSSASCIKNKYQDCIAQDNKKDCENIDKRDCRWYPDYEIFNSTDGACLPEINPGLNFWEEESDAKAHCALASKECVVTYEKDLFGDWKCEDNCECLKDSWIDKQLQVCERIGDCGAKINFLGVKGNDKGYEYSKEKISGDVVADVDKGLFNMNIILSKLGLTGRATGKEKKG